MKMKLLLAGIPLLFLYFNFSAQDFFVSGTVTSEEDGLPLPGVTILLKGNTTGTITDFDGKYQLQVPSDSSVLSFSYIGFLSTDMTVGNQTTINVLL